MESFETFMARFVQFVTSNADEELAIVLKNALQLFDNISTSDIGLVLYTILKDEKGLLHFLMSRVDKAMEKSWIEGFSLLNFVIAKFHQFLELYAHDIKGVCQSAITMKIPISMKNAAEKAFQNLIKLCPSHQLKLEETVVALVNRFHLSNEAARIYYFKILGTIAKNKPEAISDILARRIFDCLMNDLEQTQHRTQQRRSSRESAPNKLAVYMDTLSDMLLKFTPRETPEKSKQFYRVLYDVIDRYSNVAEDQRNKFVNRSAISLLGRHMHLFCDWVYQDARHWNAILWRWVGWKGDNGTVAFSTLIAFYQILGNKLQHDHTDSGRELFHVYQSDFELRLLDEDIDSRTLRLFISGYGDLAGACKIHLGDTELASMFSFMARNAYTAQFGGNLHDGLIENLAYYQLALSKIVLHMSHITREQFHDLMKLSSVLIRRFPDAPSISHVLVVESVVKTIWNVKKICGRLCEEFIQKMVYEGITWTCSHSLYLDAEIEKEKQALAERPICYRNYLPLWRSILRPNITATNNESLTVSREISSEMPRACVQLINKLNLNVKTLDDVPNVEVIDVLVAENDTDFRIFVNFVDFFETIVEDLEPASIRHQVHFFLYEIIKKSHRHPSIPGFYKLVQAILRLKIVTCDIDNAASNAETTKLLSAFMSFIIEEFPSSSEEAQLAILTVIIEMPVIIVEHFVDRLTPIFKAAFSLSHRLDVTQSAFGTLENWNQTMKSESIKPLLMKIIPSLVPFLKNSEREPESQHYDQKTLRKKPRKINEKLILKTDEGTLREFQRRVLLFLGSLNSDIISGLSAENPSDEVSKLFGNRRNLLKYTLLYSDIKPDIYLDALLPRIIELALMSTDRQTRVLACEVLHSIVIIMLGTSMKFLCLDPDHVLPLFKMIFPALLTLGSDSDQAIQQLFYPLTIQLTHWYSSKMKLKSSETAFLVEMLFKSLTYESNLTTSDFSGICLAEFVKWSIKQSEDNERETPMTNTKPIIEKIVNFALHPSIERRIGAAAAFNYLYDVVREYDEIMDTFYLQLLFCFVKALEGCNNLKITNSLKHIEKVIRYKYNLFNLPNPQRVQPVEFQGTLLTDAADWLLSQCGSFDNNCRVKSMELLKAIVKYIPNNTTVPDFIEDYLKRNGMEALERLLLEGLDERMGSLCLKTMVPLLKSLDCYIWILNENLLSSDLLFGPENTRRNLIFISIIDFIGLINVSKRDHLYDNVVEYKRENQHMVLTRSEIILKIFDFLNVLPWDIGHVSPLRMSIVIPNTVAKEELMSLISSCIFASQTVGFDSRNLLLMESLPSRIRKILEILSTALTDDDLAFLKELFKRNIENKWELCWTFDKVFDNDTYLELKFFLKGLNFLRTNSQFDHLYEVPFDNEICIAKVFDIFELLRNEKLGRMTVVELETGMKDHLSSILELFLMKFEESIVVTLVNIVASKTELYFPDSTKILHGKYFLNVFDVPIFNFLLKYTSRTLDVLTNESMEEKFDVALTMMGELLVYVKNNKRTFHNSLEELGHEFVNRFSKFQNLANYDRTRKREVVHLYAILVQTVDSPRTIFGKATELFGWITKELSNSYASDTLQYKTQLLHDFLPYLVDESLPASWNLKHCLYKLKTDYYPRNMTSVAKGTPQRFHLTACFQTILRLLPILKSATLLDCLLNLTSDNIVHFWDNNSSDILTTYFREIGAEDSLESLKMLYNCFMQTEELSSRLEVLEKLLLPCFRCAAPDGLELFYKQNVNESVRIISKTFGWSDCSVRNTIVSKIGCYNLLEIMIAKVPRERIDGIGNTIASNCDNALTNGKPLLQIITVNAVNLTKMDLPDESESKKLGRKLCCAAYNFIVAAVSLKCEEKFYPILFPESMRIWHNVIDTEKMYEFPDDPHEIPKERERSIGIRKRNGDPTATPVRSTIKSYDIASSTLAEDISRYDTYELYDVKPELVERRSEVELLRLTFESDDLNDHECMASICGFVTHVISENITCLPKNGNNAHLPKWMECLRRSLIAAWEYNVKLFLVKVTWNTQNAFKPYAAFFLPPILSFLNIHMRTRRNITYVVRDIVVMLMEWRDVAIPTDPSTRQCAQDFFEKFLENSESNQRRIYAYNLELIDTLVDAWHSCLEVPDEILRITESSPRLCAGTVLIFLRRGKEKSFVTRPEILEHLITLIDSGDEETMLQSCEALGITLEFLETTGETELKQKLTDNLSLTVIEKLPANRNKFVECMHAIHKRYPSIAKLCWQKVTSSFFSVNDSNKASCLNVFASAIPDLSREELDRELGCIGIESLLTTSDKVSTCQTAALKIVRKLVKLYSPEELLRLAMITCPYSKSSSIEQRRMVADIFIAVYENYGENSNDDDDIVVGKLKSMSRGILLLGLLDNDEELRDRILKFLTEKQETGMERAIDRFLDTFDAYDPILESSFLQILASVMLQLLSRDPGFDKKIFEPLVNCKFEEYSVNVEPSTRSTFKHPGLVAPLFTPSLASQMSQYYNNLTNPALSRFNPSSLNHSLFFRVSQSLKFSQTFLSPSAPRVESETSLVQYQRIPQPSANIKSKRFHRQETLKNVFGEEERSGDDRRQRDGIRMFRKYRIGDFPDTEIAYSCLIIPLQELVKRDVIAAKDLSVVMFSSMVNEMNTDKRKEFLGKISTSIKFMFNNSSAACSHFIASMLEIVLNSCEIDVSPSAIAKVSKSSGMLSLGALALEQRMISACENDDFQPRAKKPKLQPRERLEETQWLELAGIYKYLNDFDVVESIFEKENFGDELREASAAQSAGRWRDAKRAYERAYDANDGPIKDYCLESLFVCLTHLSDWNQITRLVGKELNDDFDALWKISAGENWMLSWTLRSHIQEMSTTGHCDEKFMAALNGWMTDKAKLRQLKELHGEEMAIMFVGRNPEFAENCLSYGLEKIRRNWMRINPLYHEQKSNEFLKLRSLTDMKLYLKATANKSEPLRSNAIAMFRHWNKNAPMWDDSLVLWNRHTAYRLYLTSLMKELLDAAVSGEETPITELHATIVKQCLNMVDAASRQRYSSIMKKYLNYSATYVSNLDLNSQLKWKLGFANYKYSRYLASKVAEQRVKTFLAAWTTSHDLLERESSDSELRVAIGRHIGTLANEIRQIFGQSDDVGLVLMENESVSKYVLTNCKETDVIKRLVDYTLFSFKKCCDFANENCKADCYFNVATYCHALLTDVQTPADAYSTEFVCATLRAMQHGSIEAGQYFPIVLNMDLNNDERWKIFEETSGQIETWMFIRWHAQLISHIGTAIRSLVTPILLRLAEMYPDAVVYTFGLTIQMNESLLSDPLVVRLEEIISEKVETRLFVDAMKWVVQPELYLQHHMNGMPMAEAPSRNAAVNELLNESHGTGKLFDCTYTMRGKFYRDINVFLSRIGAMDHMDEKELIEHKRKLIEDLNDSVKKRTRRYRIAPLESYSPWLHKFRGKNIEVPGQYTGDRKPLPQYHAKIVRLEPRVAILESLRKPIRITMLGNDGKSYKFLVKFGEDLRLDQRIEQLFMLMNKILGKDPACRQRRLHINTYEVVPLTDALGLIQWIDATISLDEMIDSTSPNLTKTRNDIANDYASWINAAAPGKNLETAYSEAVLKYTREEVTSNLQALRSRIPRDILRTAFKNISSSPERFFTLRRSFVASYATLCVGQWVLGIGDRNLSNTLISYDSGETLGIDFAYSFDAAVNLAVPELVPFRLTSHILELLLPFDENGLLRVAMIHVLRALGKGKEALVACMDIFVKEPSLDWQVRKKQDRDQEEEFQERRNITDAQRYPMEKIKIVTEKLGRVKPSKIVLAQIQDRYHDPRFLNKYTDIINGSNNGKELREQCRHREENLSVEEQVACLLDAATDPNILGRTWAGWEPWI